MTSAVLSIADRKYHMAWHLIWSLVENEEDKTAVEKVPGEMDDEIWIQGSE